jgi:endonuclease/exonuclease/phosphatase family metal-dependent hydrolase
MDYRIKYIKYKQKYIKLKSTNMKGGNLNSVNIATINTKQIYDTLSENQKDEFPFFCQDDKPFLCTLESPSYGLCKSKVIDCMKYEGENKLPEYDLSIEKRQEQLNLGKRYGYNLYDNEDKDCSKLIENSTKYSESEREFLVPQKFKIMTYNCWWSMKTTSNEEENAFNLIFLENRITYIARIIIESSADIICLQEVGRLTFDILLKLLQDNYPFYYENPFENDFDNNGPRGRNIETVCFTKFPAKGFKLFSVQGNLQYNNSMILLEFDNLIVFNVYLQAGTRNSPGQKDLWYNYSRCRYNEYLAIGKYMIDNEIKKPIVVLGDFNTNLNGSITEWPELKAFSKLKLQDSCLDLYDNNGGFTEDTSVNLMRWNVKFEEKIYRIDGIFYTKDKFKTNNIEILGNQPFNIDEKMQLDFDKYKIPNKPNKNELIRKNDGKLQIWPSDHFAVMSELEFI